MRDSVYQGKRLSAQISESAVPIILAALPHIVAIGVAVCLFLFLLRSQF